MRETIRNAEQGETTLRNIVDHLLIDHRSVKEITNHPRSFRIKTVNREDLLAPTVLPFEMGLCRVGNVLVATTGGEKSFPTQFGLNMQRRTRNLSEAFDRARTIADIETLEAAETEKARASGWYAHWHPIGAASRLDLPSFKDVESEGDIQFMLDEYNVSVFHTVKDFEAHIKQRLQAQIPAPVNNFEVLFGDRKRHKLAYKIYTDMLIREAGLKQISWSDKQHLARVCDFMNGLISKAELEESLG